MKLFKYKGLLPTKMKIEGCFEVEIWYFQTFFTAKSCQGLAEHLRDTFNNQFNKQFQWKQVENHQNHKYNHCWIDFLSLFCFVFCWTQLFSVTSKFEFWTEQVIYVSKLFKYKTIVGDLISQNFEQPVYLVWFVYFVSL